VTFRLSKYLVHGVNYSSSRDAFELNHGNTITAAAKVGVIELRQQNPHPPKVLLYFAANLLLALREAPKMYSTKIPTMHTAVKAPSKLTPGPTPRLWNSGLEKSTAAAASIDLTKSFPAKSDPAYAG